MFDVGKENSLIGKGVSMDRATILARVLGGVLLKWQLRKHLKEMRE